jgi:hypothetical protein
LDSVNALGVVDYAALSPVEALYSEDFCLDELALRLYEFVLSRDQMADR